MAFCKYCGRKLEENEVCNCRSNVENTSESTGTSTRTEQNNVKTDVILETIKSTGGKIIGVFANIFKNPSSAVNEYVKKDDLIVSLILILCQALLSGFMALDVIKNIRGKIAGLGEYISILTKFLPTNGKVMGMAVVLSLLFSVIIAVLWYATLHISKANNITISESIVIASIRSIVCIPVIIISLVVSVINMPVAIGIYILSYFISTYFYVGVLQNEEIAEAKKFYLPMLITVLFVIIAVIILYSTRDTFVPKSIKSILNGDLGGIGDMLGF